MNCDMFKRYGILYSYSELPESEMRQMNEHIKSCLFCRREIKSIESIKKTLNYIEEQKAPELDYLKIFTQKPQGISHYFYLMQNLVFLLKSRHMAISFIAIFLLFAASIFITFDMKKYDSFSGSSGKKSFVCGAFHDDLSWNDGESEALNDIKSQVDMIEGPGKSLYEMKIKFDRRCDEDIIYKCRQVYAYQDELSEIGKGLNNF